MWWNTHITPFLHKLHWFLIQHLILFKYNLITCMTINFSQPPYLSDLIKHCDLTRGNRLSVSSTRPNKRMGSHSFAAAANTKWNKLPQTIRTQDSINGFRQQLKTYLFRIIILPNWTLKWIWTIFFWKLDYPFLDISALEDVSINLALYKCFMLLLLSSFH